MNLLLSADDLLRGRSITPQFDARVILESFVPGYELLPETFEELKIPLKIVEHIAIKDRLLAQLFVAVGFDLGRSAHQKLHLELVRVGRILQP